MNQYKVQNIIIEKGYNNVNPFNMGNYAQTGFTLDNIKQDMDLKDLEVTEKKQTRKEFYKRKDESELTQVQLEMVDNFFKESDVDLSELRRQAREDYELQQNNLPAFIWKRGRQAMKKDAPSFVWQKTKEIFIEKPIDYLTNNPVVNTIKDIINYIKQFAQY